MTQSEPNTSYTFLAVALAAALLYRPVTAADPAGSVAQGEAQPPATEAVSEPVQQDFDALISEIESELPAQTAPEAASGAEGASGSESEELAAARIQIDILRQAVVAALAARAEAEAQLETLWRDSRAEIEALKAVRSEGATRISALERELAKAKGEGATVQSGGGTAKQAGYGPSDQAAVDGANAAGQPGGEAAAVAPAAGPTEIMLNEIHFNPGSASLTPGARRKTLEAADKIKALSASNVRVSGYTDTQGPAAHNVHLSLERAKSIADLLASVGVSSEIIEIEGNGEEGAPEPTEDQVSEPLNRCAGIFALAELPASQAQR